MDSKTLKTLLTGNSMPVIGLGTWQLRGDEALAAISYALEVGYRLIDTSGDYANQRQVGKAIKQSGIRRQDIFVVTKVEEDEDAYDAAQRNLDQLGLAYADLVLIHRPPRRGAGIPLWEGLIRAWEEGVAKDIGVSNYSTSQIEELTAATTKIPVVNQIEWSPFGYSPDMAAFCKQHAIVIQAYSPLTRTKRLNEPVLAKVAATYNKTPAQLLIRWNIQHDAVPIPKATSQAHITENAKVFDFAIAPKDMARLDALNEHYSALSSLPYV